MVAYASNNSDNKRMVSWSDGAAGIRLLLLDTKSIDLVYLQLYLTRIMPMLCSAGIFFGFGAR